MSIITSFLCAHNQGKSKSVRYLFPTYFLQSILYKSENRRGNSSKKPALSDNSDTDIHQAAYVGNFFLFCHNY